jgi:hypothetical protein
MSWGLLPVVLNRLGLHQASTAHLAPLDHIPANLQLLWDGLLSFSNAQPPGGHCQRPLFTTLGDGTQAPGGRETSSSWISSRAPMLPGWASRGRR